MKILSYAFATLSVFSFLGGIFILMKGGNKDGAIGDVDRLIG